MLHPQAKRKSQSKADLAPELETAEQRQVSVEKDLALTIRAARQERENAVQAGQIQNDDQRFELSRRRILFGAELMLTVAGFIALLALLIVNQALVPLGVSGGGGFGGLLLLLRRSAN